MIGLYFGSFNPVHVGHLGLAEYLLTMQLVDEVWFVVSPCNPLKRQSDLLDEQVRMHMLQLAVNHCPRMKVSDIEFTLPVPSYTVDTIDVLSSRFKDLRFALVIGSDNALLFDKWKEPEKILARYPVLVYPRRGYDFSEVASKYPQMQLISTPYYDVSSTEIRNDISQGKDVSDRLHPLVWEYIQKEKLYR